MLGIKELNTITQLSPWAFLSNRATQRSYFSFCSCTSSHTAVLTPREFLTVIQAEVSDLKHVSLHKPSVGAVFQRGGDALTPLSLKPVQILSAQSCFRWEETLERDFNKYFQSVYLVHPRSCSFWINSFLCSVLSLRAWPSWIHLRAVNSLRKSVGLSAALYKGLCFDPGTLKIIWFQSKEGTLVGSSSPVSVALHL